MAQFFPVKASVAMRLNTGVDPNTGKSILKTVSISRVDPAMTAANLKAVSDLLEPLFVHPLVSVEKSATDLLESA